MEFSEATPTGSGRSTGLRTALRKRDSQKANSRNRRSEPHVACIDALKLRGQWTPTLYTTAVSLIGFAAWLVLLTFAVAFFRIYVTATARKALNAYRPDGSESVRAGPTVNASA
jgi:hypothetical protein